MPPTQKAQELYRKSFHVAGVALLPISLIESSLVPWILLAAVLIYAAEQLLTREGKPIPLLSALIKRCKRPDRYTRIDAGPFFLAIGVGLPFLFFPLPVAHLALLQVCLADAAASVVTFYLPTKLRLPYAPMKSWTGSAAFFLVAFLCSWIYLPGTRALIAALVGTLLESIPIRDLDNVTVPLGVAAFIALVGWIPA